MSNLSCGTHVAEPSANKDCRKLLNQFCRFLPKLKLPISADAKLPLTTIKREIAFLKKSGYLERIGSLKTGYWKVNSRFTHSVSCSDV